MIVVDASLVAKWFFREADSAQAFAFLSAPARDLGAPDILFLEVAGAIVRRANTEKALREDALGWLELLGSAWSDQLVTSYRLTQRRLLRASGLALQLGTPLKDCVYLQLAMELGCDLATCDVRFRDKAAAVYPLVKLLSEYPT